MNKTVRATGAIPPEIRKTFREGRVPSSGAVTHKIQADFSGTPFGGSPTWTDITAYWLSSSNDPGGSPVTIPWGRQDQSSVVESSTTSILLNNADGRFTPGKASSPYYPNVKRHIRMRYTITDGTTTLTMYDGYADSWQVQFGYPPTSTVSLSDAFARLQTTTVLRGLYVEEALVDAPVLYYALDEGSGSASFGTIVGSGTGVVTASKYGAGSVSAGVEAGPTVAFPGPVASFANGTSVTGQQSVIALPGYTAPVTNILSIEFWMRTTMVPPGGTGGGASSMVSLVYLNAGNAVIVKTDMLAFEASYTSPYPLNDGAWHHIVFTTHPTHGRQYYVDGAACLGTPLIGGGLANTNVSPIWLGGNFNFIPAVPLPYTGDLAHVAIYSTELTADRVLAHYNAGKTAFSGESTSARWARLLTYRPNIGGSTTSTLGSVGAGDLAGMSLGDALTDTTTAEGGVVQTHRGSIDLTGRAKNYDATPTLTLNAATGQVDAPTTWRDDTQGLLNEVDVSRPNGATQRAANATSIAADGVVQTSVTANVNSDRDAADMAGWMVAAGVQEALGSPTLSVNLYARNSTTLTMALCALNTLDTVTVTNLPAFAPASAMTFQVQGGTFTVGADQFAAEFYATTVPPLTLRADATADAYTKLDNGLVFAW